MPKKGTEEPVTGVFTGHAKGFGFVTAEGMEEDIYIGEEDVHGALHQDTVQVRLKPLRDGKRREGTIIKILSRGMLRLVGIYEESKNYGFVVPDNGRYTRDIFVPKEH